MVSFTYLISQFLKRPLLPRIPPAELLCNVKEVRICEPAPIDGNIEILELALICAVIQNYKPKKLFEFGTFDGRTTLNLAVSSIEDAIVYTLDLPASFENPTQFPLDINDKAFVRSRHQTRFAGTAFDKKIIQLYGDSARFDYSNFQNQMDFVFVDGSHSYLYVMNDSWEALRLLNDKRGAILWHDYAHWPGVTRALNRLYSTAPDFSQLRHIQGTTLAYLCLGL